jgi:hypothetical protein
MTEHSFQGITSSLKKGKSVTYVSGTICHPCVGSRTFLSATYANTATIRIDKELR